MNIRQFIYKAFDKIQTSFPYAKLTYQFKDASNTHFIKVSPSSVFNTETFVGFDFDLSDEFESLGFGGSLCFLTEGSLVELNNPSIIVASKNPYSQVFAIMEGYTGLRTQ